MSDIHLWYVNMYILYNNIYKSFHPDAEVCVLWASHALRISHATTYTVHMLYVLYCRWLFKEAYILVWHTWLRKPGSHTPSSRAFVQKIQFSLQYMLLWAGNTLRIHLENIIISLLLLDRPVKRIENLYGFCQQWLYLIYLDYPTARFITDYRLYNWHILSVVL